MVLLKILNNRCPNCQRGSIFKEGNIYFNFRRPNMNEDCNKCGLKYSPEPGFFYGAMYVSYVLTVLQGIITFLISNLFFEKMFDPRIIGIIAVVMVLLSSFNMRISRILWIYLFRKTKS